MQVFKIPEALERKYHGGGYALCSVTGGQIVDLVCIRAVIEEFDDDGEDAKSILAALGDERLAHSVRMLQSTGEVFAGMCSCWEFVVL